MIGSVLEFLGSIQTSINQIVVADLRAFAETRNWLGLAAILPLGVLFGAVHALTPGHSKLILATYLAGSSHSTVRAIGIASVLSVTHIATAVLIAALALPIITRTLVGAGRALVLEDLSRGLLALVGAWMVVQAVRRSTAPEISQSRGRDGVAVGMMAGLIPCPLTLFTMGFAISRGVPEAGFTFALAMMLGVTLTLSCVAVFAVMARNRFAQAVVGYVPTINVASRILQLAAGALLVTFGVGVLADD